jgi:hypothetical protein
MKLQISSLQTLKVSTFVFVFPIVLVYFMPIQLFGLTLKNDLVLFLSLALFVFNMAFLSFSFKSGVITYLVYGMFFSCVFLLILLRNQSEIVIKDIVECFKPMYFVLMFIFGRKAAENYHIETVRGFIIVLLIIGIFFSILVYLPFSYPLVDMYKGRTSEEVDLYQFFRFSGFFGYPSMFGIYLILGLMLNFTSRSPSRLITIFLILGFLLTISKTGFVLLGLVGIYMLAYNAEIKSLFKAAFSLALIFFVLTIYFYDQFIEVFNAFNSIDGLMQSTFYHRFREIIESANILSSENFDGFGPSNSYLQINHGPVENVIFFYVFKFGYFGLFYYINLIAFVFYHFYNEKNPTFKVVLFWCLISLLVGSLSESVTEEYKTLYFFPVLLGYFTSSKHYRINDPNIHS